MKLNRWQTKRARIAELERQLTAARVAVHRMEGALRWIAEYHSGCETAAEEYAAMREMARAALAQTGDKP